jgi:hypothetical protein
VGSGRLRVWRSRWTMLSVAIPRVAAKRQVTAGAQDEGRVWAVDTVRAGVVRPRPHPDGVVRQLQARDMDGEV